MNYLGSGAQQSLDSADILGELAEGVRTVSCVQCMFTYLLTTKGRHDPAKCHRKKISK